MEVRTCNISTWYYHPSRDYFSGSYLLVLGNELLREVTIDGLQAIVVTDYDELTITTTVVSYYANFAREVLRGLSRQYKPDVHTFMLAAKAGAR